MGESVRALIADGDAGSRKVAASVLRDLDVEVSQVSDAQVLLRRVRELEPDLLLVDAGMVTLGEVKAMQRSLPSMNVLFTHPAQDAGKFAGAFGSVLVVGTTDFLSKPFGRAQLKHRVLTLDAMRPSVGIAADPASGEMPLLELFDPESGRLDATRVARFLGIPLKALAQGLGRPYGTVHKTPHAPGLQADLQVIHRILELLTRLLGTREATLAWLNTPSPDLSGETPLHLVTTGHADAVRSLLENTAAGAPS